MKFSTRVEYGLRALSYLDTKRQEAKSLRSIARAEKLSLPYLERIFSRLKERGLVYAVKGKSGGYLLSDKPSAISVSQVVEALDGAINPYQCARGGAFCQKGCTVSAVWKKIYPPMEKTLRNIKLSQILKK